MIKPTLSIALVGPPASGKGTCAQAIHDTFGLPVISPGEIYRKLRTEDSDLGRDVKAYLSEGGYCPDSLTNPLMTKQIQKNPFGISDGYPRTVSQLVYLLNSCSVLLFLHTDAPYPQLLEAALSRKTCAQCKRVYNLNYHETWCDCTGSPLMETRFDDTPEMFPKRYQTYLESTAPIVDLVSSLDNYKKFKIIFEPDGVSNMLSYVEKMLSSYDLKNIMIDSAHY